MSGPSFPTIEQVQVLLDGVLRAAKVCGVARADHPQLDPLFDGPLALMLLDDIASAVDTRTPLDSKLPNMEER